MFTEFTQQQQLMFMGCYYYQNVGCFLFFYTFYQCYVTFFYAFLSWWKRVRLINWSLWHSAILAHAQTHCALVTCDSGWVTVAFYSAFWTATEVGYSQPHLILLPSRHTSCVHRTTTHQFTVSLQSKPLAQGACVFICNHPPASANYSQTIITMKVMKFTVLYVPTMKGGKQLLRRS